MQRLISIPWARWTQGVILPDKDLHSEAFLLNKIEIHPYVKRLTKTFFNFFVCKHDMSLIFQRAGKKKSHSRNPKFSISGWDNGNLACLKTPQVRGNAAQKGQVTSLLLN